jgi:hypothetical protein
MTTMTSRNQRRRTIAVVTVIAQRKTMNPK